MVKLPPPTDTASGVSTPVAVWSGNPILPLGQVERIAVKFIAPRGDIRDITGRRSREPTSDQWPCQNTTQSGQDSADNHTTATHITPLIPLALPDETPMHAG